MFNLFAREGGRYAAAALRLGTTVLIGPLCAAGAEEPLELPKMAVYSEHVANQVPSSTFPMPVSGLQFEPRVDVQARNLAESQADIAIRGGVFENTGFTIGSVGMVDPQTGHYLAEMPVAPAMLAPPEVRTGIENAFSGFNAQVGSVAYDWRPIDQRGELAVAIGNHGTNRQSLYQGLASSSSNAEKTWAADFELARSESDGSVPAGDHDFRRAAARLQRRDGRSQTDVFAGWQEKFFGWPNLYTPFGFNETEYLKTQLFVVNHRASLSPREYWQVGAYYRRNYDDYEFNRATPGASNPFIHTTRVRSLAADGRIESGDWALAYSGQYLEDSLQSTALTFGRFSTRQYVKAGLLPEFQRSFDGGQITLRGGATYDDTNRDDSAISPLFALEFERASGLRLYAEYAESSQVATYTALNSNPSAGLFRGNPDLGRETSRNLEAGFEWTRGRWVVQGAVFRRRDGDLVDWTFRSGVTARTANAVGIVTDGLELVAVLNAKSCDLILSYACLEKDADYGAAVVEASFYALNFPRHRVTAALIARLAPGLELRVDNEWRLQESNPLRVQGGDDAFLTSAGIYWVPRRVPSLQVSVRLDNAWDDEFQEVPAVPAARRQWSAGLAWRW